MKIDWIQTANAYKVHPLSASVEEIDLRDIAHSLFNQQRFTGHCWGGLSVGQHSMAVASLCSYKNRLWALLHDASEAYLCDLPTPIKSHPKMTYYRRAEKRLMQVICDKFELPHKMPDEVKEADNLILHAEAQNLIPITYDHMVLEKSQILLNEWGEEPSLFAMKAVSRAKRYTKDNFIDEVSLYLRQPARDKEENE